MTTHERTPLIDPDSAAPRRGASSRRRSVSGLASVGALGALAVVAALTGTTRAVTRALASAGNDDDDVFAVGVFDDAPELRAEVRVEGLDRPLTLPWQPVSEGGRRGKERRAFALGAVSGHGLHCDMRAMAWLFADVPANIPTAVFGARASSRADSKLLAGADAWLEGVEASAASSLTALEDALVARVGFESQADDFVAVADAAGYREFVAVGESQSAAAALWAGVRQAERARDSALGATSEGAGEGSLGRVRGLVLTLVPTMGTERAARYEEMRARIAETFGDAANATDILRADLEDCSVGYGCVPFAKYLAAKKSDLPSLDTLRELKEWFPPTLVLADYADEPAHPVENGRLVAEALGARFGVVNTREEREARWPGEVATFIRRVYEAETGARASATSLSSLARGVRGGVRNSRRSLLDAHEDASGSLALTEDQLRASSRLCVGDSAATPTLEERCESLTARESEAWKEERAAREAVEAAAEDAANGGGFATDAPPPPLAFSPFYLRTGLDVEECEESDLGDRRGRVAE